MKYIKARMWWADTDYRCLPEKDFAMRNTLSIVLLLAAGWWSAPLAGQEPLSDDSPMLLEEQLEQLSAELGGYDWEEELQELSALRSHPLNLNTATRKDLERFPFLSDFQVEELQAYIYEHGPMVSIYELQLVKGMDRRTLELLVPFVCIRLGDADKLPRFRDMLKQGRHEVLARFDTPVGYTRKGYERNYLGPPVYHSLRYQYALGERVQWGLTAEKDAGEPFFGLHNGQGYDHYSVYFYLTNNYRRLRKLVVGSYRLGFGQGLVVNSGFSMGKTFGLSTARHRETGIRKYGSTAESGYFNGVAATVALSRQVAVSAFYSYRRLDAAIADDGAITSLPETGLHRTQTEADRKWQAALQVAGGNVGYNRGNLKLGLTGLYYFYDRPYQPNLREYSKYNLQGNRFYNIGLDYSLKVLPFLWLSGEAAKGKSGFALLSRADINLSTAYRLLLIHRFYSYDYWALFARSFGEGSSVQNENGWYVAMEATPLNHWTFFLSADLFSFPWWRYRISKPSQGADLMAQALFDSDHGWKGYLNYRYKRKERDVTGTGGELTLPTHHHRARLRLQWESDGWQLHYDFYKRTLSAAQNNRGGWRLQTTADYNRFHMQGMPVSSGWQLTQAVACIVKRKPSLTLSAQGTYFQTDDYDSRVYAYERSLLNTFYTPSFSGQGFRYSAVARIDPWWWLMLQVKVGQTVYLDRDEISSGNDLIRGNRKTDLQLLLRLRF